MLIDIDTYIEMINSEDPKLTIIELSGRQLDDDSIAPLMTALYKKPKIAKQITEIYLGNNKLTSISLQIFKELQVASIFNNRLKNIYIKGLEKLEIVTLYTNSITSIDINKFNNIKKLQLEGNPLSEAFVIALETLTSIRFSEIKHDYLRLTNETLLTDEIIDSHFKNLLAVNNDLKNRYFIEAITLLSSSLSLPSDIMRLIVSYGVVETGCASMVSLKNIFERSMTSQKTERKQLLMLTTYEKKRLPEITKNTKRIYYEAFNNLENFYTSAMKKKRALLR